MPAARSVSGLTVMVSVPEPATRQLEAGIVWAMDPSERLWIVISPVPATTGSLNVNTTAESTGTLVAPLIGIVDTRVGTPASAVVKFTVVVSVIPANGVPPAVWRAPGSTLT